MEILFLDPNAYTGFMTGDESVLELLGRAESIHVSLFVLAEL